MAYAALTYVFNEQVNLPVWVRYYGNLFGPENLFVVDRQSNDGSTDDLGKVNVIRVPRTKFDDNDKSHAMSSIHSALLRSYDAVVCSDCDEVLVSDPAKYADLNDYISNHQSDYSTGVGLNLVHAIDREPPLDLHFPILAQRKYASFASSECKTLLSRVALTWAPGLHSTSLPPKIDLDLFVFHLKLMDYNMAMIRQKINQDTAWSDKSLQNHHGVHHRYELKRFVTETFFSTVSMLEHNNVSDFLFQDVVNQLISRTTRSDRGFYEVPFGISKTVVIPERFASVI